MLRGFPEYSPLTDEPNVAQLMYSLTNSSYLRAAERDVRVVLTGYAGDQVFGYNYYYIADYLRKYKFMTFIKEANKLSRVLNEPLYSTALEYGFKPLQRKGNRFEHSLMSEENYHKANERYISKHFELMPGERSQFEFIDQAPQLYIFARDYISEPLKMESRHPFLDVDLVKFLYGIPLEIKTKNARSKGILIEAMKGVLPEKVLSRPGKSTTNALIFEGFKQEYHKLKRVIQQSILQEYGIVSTDLLMSNIEQLRQGNLRNIGKDFFPVLSLELWLQRKYKYSFAK